MALLLIVALPFLGLALPYLGIRAGRSACAWVTALPPAVALALLMANAPAVFSGETLTAGWPWLPALGLELAFVLDGYSFLFAGLVLVIGLLIVLYARYYLSPEDSMARFFAMLLAFMGSMLGIVLSNNLLLMVVFWELTSISSFLLIGYWNHSSEARQGARMALAVTGAGGLCLLAGMLMLGHIVGSYELTTVLDNAERIQADPLYAPTLILILLGAFTKSAQVPFHFWLPHAMAAPTPVSAYLHSATMVKAGVFLLARMFPALAGTDLWFFLVTGVGLATLVFGAYAALFKDDLKGLLAYSTISHLGLITLLFGLGTDAGAVAGVFHIINHATFKASLFMAAGIIDHEAGTRDIRRLGGLRRHMPHTMWLASIAAASMAGVPLLNGFLSKEMFFAEVVTETSRLGAWGWGLPVLATIGGLLSAAYSIRFVHDVFFGDPRAELPKTPHEPPRYMRVPVEVLIALCVAVGVAPALVIAPLLETAASGVLRGEVPYYSLAIWHGFNLPLLMSTIALVGGALLYWKRDAAERTHEEVFPAITGKGCFDAVVEASVGATSRLTALLDNGRVQRNVVLLVGTAIVVGAYGALSGGYSVGSVALTPAPWLAVGVWAVLLVALALLVRMHHRRITAVILVGVAGLISAITFVYISAPDLAMTQLSVEVVSVVLFLLALRQLPKQTPPGGGRRLRDAVVALLGGGGMAALAYALMTRPFDSISAYHLAESVPGGGGHNVVNVILVDFRGFDTFGEITVLGIAAVCVYALLAGAPEEPGSDPEKEASHPLMLLIGSQIMMPMLGMIAAYIFLRGHNLPGGGFIAGLVATVALVAQYMSAGMKWTENRLPPSYFPVFGAGLVIAGLTGLGSWLFGAPFLTSAYTYVHWPVVGKFELATAVAFDVGVFLTVVGSVMMILARMGRLSPLPGQEREAG